MSVRAWLVLVLSIALVGMVRAEDDAVMGVRGDRPRVMVVLWRGCEDACRGFLDYIEARGIDAEYIIRNAGTDASRLPSFVREAEELRPDLLLTWGTSVTVGMLGTLDGDDRGVVGDIPSVFMIVADPVGAGIVEAYERSGRPHVTGTRNRVPESTQLRVLSEYRPLTRVGIIYNDNELNAVLNAAELRVAADEAGITLVERVLRSGADGTPQLDDLPAAMAEIAAHEVDFLYVGSSSFIVANSDRFTTTALEFGLPVATAYEAMVRSSRALIALATPYYNVGQLAGFQAEQILVHGRRAGDLEIVGLDRFTVLVNIETAHALGFYPPMKLLRYAEIVAGP